MKIAAVLILFATVALADLYMHVPRGSNNRLNEANTNRNNANRIFDSQNNGKGGYCVGPAMDYYEGSLLTIVWTNQHGCGTNPKLTCNLVIQYMCGDSDAPLDTLIRNGATTDRIENNANSPLELNGNGDPLYGMNEAYANYLACETRERNMGLYIADREQEGNLNGGRRSAIFTRQNNNGNRHGYECTEERDYYPYWHPTPWRDIAVLASNEDYCEFYRKESFNVKEKGHCVDGNGDEAEQNNEQACEANGNTWRLEEPWGIGAPDCVQSPWSRHNHLGNGPDGFENSYNASIPNEGDLPCIRDNNCNCVLRMRYNISTEDDGTKASNPFGDFLDWTGNEGNSAVQQDPIVSVDNLPHELALNTNQYGRTFQDRSHIFHISKRPSNIGGTSRIFNLNVKGKRGNIVQAYPSTEYDFNPSYLHIRVGDFIHFQWSGCDTNPAGNAGEGTDQTDRNNIVQTEKSNRNKPASDRWLDSNTPLFDTPELRRRMAMLDQDQNNCLDKEALLAQNNNNNNDAEQDVQNCMKLNGAPTPYFNGGAHRMNKTGTFYYMSTRNNNFTNRGQKGIIYVEPLLPTWAVVIIIIGAVLFVASAGVAGAMLYAKSHPHSAVANVFTKI